jgi:hypothetical protein
MRLLVPESIIPHSFGARGAQSARPCTIDISANKNSASELLS